MNREDVIRWAREANIKQAIETPHLLLVNELERFAALVAAAERKEMAEHCAEITRMAVEKAVGSAITLEREACALVCLDMQQGWASDDHLQCADAIRARKDNT